MTGIKIVCVGRVKEDFFRDGIAAYVKEIRKKYSMDIMECPDEPPITKTTSEDTVENTLSIRFFHADVL